MFPEDTRILVVDDAKTIYNLILGILNSLGYKNVEYAEDGEQALETILNSSDGENNFDLVIADIHMPNMNGLQLLDSCKKDRELQNIPFIIVTTETEKQTVLAAVVKGASSYLIKPFTADELKKRLSEVYEKTQTKGRKLNSL